MPPKIYMYTTHSNPIPLLCRNLLPLSQNERTRSVNGRAGAGERWPWFRSYPR